ncbi:hypothetical protein ACWEKM_19355 [Streptomyces sp. NPDC004752]
MDWALRSVARAKLFHRPKYPWSGRHGQIHCSDAMDRLSQYSGTVVNDDVFHAQSPGGRTIPRIA